MQFLRQDFKCCVVCCVQADRAEQSGFTAVLFTEESAVQWQLTLMMMGNLEALRYLFINLNSSLGQF